MMGESYNAAGGAWDTAGDGGHYSVMVFVTLCGQSIAAEPGSVLYPDDRYEPNRELVLKEGRVTAYRLERSGGVLAQKSIKLSKTVRVRACRPRPRERQGLAQGELRSLGRLLGPRDQRLLRARPHPA